MLSGAVGTRPEAWVDLRNLSGYFVVACSRLCFADSRLPPPLPPLPPVSSSSFLASPFGRRACSGRTSDRTGGRVRACSSLPRVQVLPLASPRVPVVSRFFFFFLRRRVESRARTSPKWLECVSSRQSDWFQGFFFFFFC